jgi:hypothetical protein
MKMGSLSDDDVEYYEDFFVPGYCGIKFCVSEHCFYWQCQTCAARGRYPVPTFFKYSLDLVRLFFECETKCKHCDDYIWVCPECPGRRFPICVCRGDFSHCGIMFCGYCTDCFYFQLNDVFAQNNEDMTLTMLLETRARNNAIL